MQITKETPPNSRRYDWSLLVEAAVQNPCEWICEKDWHPSTTAYSIRRGMPLAFDPSGSFDALVRKDGLYVRYLGVPIVPWIYYDDERSFQDLKRTIDPDLFPDDEATNRFRPIAELHTPRKAIKRERRAREAGQTLEPVDLLAQPAD